MSSERQFEEDVVCDHCCMEIDGPGIPSGYSDGEEDDGYIRSGWMHKSVRICRSFINEEKNLRLFEDGEFTPPKSPPARV